MQPWQDRSRDVEDRVDALMAELTLEEKAGQLGSVWPVPPAESDEGLGDVAPMSTAFSQGTPWEKAVEHGLGHITRNYGADPISVPDGIAQLRRLQSGVVASSRHHIPAIVHEECLTGFTALRRSVHVLSQLGAAGALFADANERRRTPRRPSKIEAPAERAGAACVW